MMSFAHTSALCLNIHTYVVLQVLNIAFESESHLARWNNVQTHSSDSSAWTTNKLKSPPNASKRQLKKKGSGCFAFLS